MAAWRHLRAILLCPGVVTIIVPALLLWWSGDVGVGWGFPGALAALPVLLGAALIGLGLALVAWTVRLFATVGYGTLAPWDPTSRLVVRGPYRHLRHPMISGVVLVLAGRGGVARFEDVGCLERWGVRGERRVPAARRGSRAAAPVR